MTDNQSSRKVVRDGDFTSVTSRQYQDIKEGTVELTSFEQPGGAGTAITAVTFSALRGRDYTVSSPSITDTDITGFFAGVGVVPTAARSFDLSFTLNFSRMQSLNSASTVGTLEMPANAGGAAGVTVNSSTVSVDNVGISSMNMHIILEIWGASDAAIYTFLASLLGSDPLLRLSFVSKAAK